MTFCQLDQDLLDLNAKYRFVDIDMADPAWAEEDEDGNEHSHRTITVHLSHIGYTQDDPNWRFDDISVAEAVRQVHKEVFG